MNMEKAMRNAPSFAVLVVMIIQVDRVSAFGQGIGAGWLSWVFAIFLAGVIYILSYWYSRTKYEITADAKDPKQAAKLAQQKRMARMYGNTRLVSGAWLFIFIAIEGSLNFFETMQELPAGVSQWQFAGAIVYGGFPTLAAFGLGSLQALIDRIPNGVASHSFAQVIFETLMRRIDTQSGAQNAQSAQGAKNATHKTQDAAQNAKNATHETHDAKRGAKGAQKENAYPRACPHGCGAQLHNAQQYSAHIGRWCEVVKAKNALNAQAANVPVELPTAAEKAEQ